MSRFIDLYGQGGGKSFFILQMAEPGQQGKKDHAASGTEKSVDKSCDGPAEGIPDGWFLCAQINHPGA